MKSQRKRKRKTIPNLYGGSLAYTYQNDLSNNLDELHHCLVKFSVAVGDFDEYVDNEGADALNALRIEIRALLIPIFVLKSLLRIRWSAQVLSDGLSYFGRTINAYYYYFH